MKRLIARSGVNRRMALKAMMAMGLAPPALGRAAAVRLEPGGAGTGTGPRNTLTDPDLVHPQVPWERTLGDAELRTLAVLADLILPADARSPAASTLGAQDFVDEWVSAPYPRQQADRRVLLDGLVWLAETADARFGATFEDLEPAQQTAICDDVCDPARAAPEHAAGALFFSLVRDLTAAAVWTTEAGMADLGYVGNVPLPSWEPPPDAVLVHLGLKPPRH